MNRRSFFKSIFAGAMLPVIAKLKHPIERVMEDIAKGRIHPKDGVSRMSYYKNDLYGPKVFKKYFLKSEHTDQVVDLCMEYVIG